MAFISGTPRGFGSITLDVLNSEESYHTISVSSGYVYIEIFNGIDSFSEEYFGSFDYTIDENGRYSSFDGTVTSVKFQDYDGFYGVFTRVFEAKGLVLRVSDMPNLRLETYLPLLLSSDDTIIGEDQDDLGDTLLGYAGNDKLYGLGGDDLLDGGVGSDIMVGGSGSDIYIVEAGDIVTEDAAAGIDTIRTRLSSYTLGDHIENLELSGTAVASGTGNALANEITGNEASNFIDGKTGADTLRGLAGDDTYYVDSGSDVVVEATTGGYDKVWTTTSYTIAAGNEVEELLTLGTGNGVNLTGNEFAQILRGNAGANRLDGRGGADTMIGRGGDDIYYVNATGDVVVEAAKGGIDTIYTALTMTLAGNQEIEFLRTTDVNSAAGMNMIGNDGAQSIFGNVGLNKLLGQGGDDKLYAYAGNDQLYGGAGRDTLSGGAGNDSFIFNTALSAATNLDTVLDFTNASGNDDRLLLDDSFFSKLSATGAMKAAFFKANVTGRAEDADDYIVYETDTGKLFYDADGSGAGAAIQFALLSNKSAITAADFFVI